MTSESVSRAGRPVFGGSEEHSSFHQSSTRTYNETKKESRSIATPSFGESLVQHKVWAPSPLAQVTHHSSEGKRATWVKAKTNTRSKNSSRGVTRSWNCSSTRTRGRPSRSEPSIASTSRPYRDRTSMDGTILPCWGSSQLPRTPSTRSSQKTPSSLWAGLRGVGSTAGAFLYPTPALYNIMCELSTYCGSIL